MPHILRKDTWRKLLWQEDDLLPEYPYRRTRRVCRLGIGHTTIPLHACLLQGRGSSPFPIRHQGSSKPQPPGLRDKRSCACNANILLVEHAAHAAWEFDFIG